MARRGQRGILSRGQRAFLCTGGCFPPVAGGAGQPDPRGSSPLLLREGKKLESTHPTAHGSASNGTENSGASDPEVRFSNSQHRLGAALFHTMGFLTRALLTFWTDAAQGTAASLTAPHQGPHHRAPATRPLGRQNHPAWRMPAVHVFAHSSPRSSLREALFFSPDKRGN